MSTLKSCPLRQGAPARPPSSGESLENVLDVHAMAEIRVDEAGLDAAVLPYDQRRGDRQQPPAIALKLREVDAELAVHILDLVAHPEHEAKGERIGQIEVGQHRERQTA